MPVALDTIRDRVEGRYDAYLDALRALVAIDSGSGDVEGVDRVGDVVAAMLGGAGYDVQRPRGGPANASAVVATRRGDGGARLLLCGHLDTVFPRGTAQSRPFAVSGDRATGPGVSDDKGGLLAGVTALQVLDDLGFRDFGQVTLVATPDEEVGSPSSRPLLEELAACHDAALCLECAREDGRLVIARKGVADAVLEITGRAAHAGIEPERGVNAALVAGQLALDLAALDRSGPDVTVNVGIVSSGDRANVVPGHGRVVADVRTRHTSSFRQVVEEIHRIAERPSLPGASIKVQLENVAPPWEADPASRSLAETAAEVAADLGLEIGFARTGGSADANLLAAAGIPALDGLGPVGGGDHSPEEWLDLATVTQRITLLTGLVARLGTPSRTC